MNDSFNKNDYETPDHIAKIMARLMILTDQKVLEPCAGTGQILKAVCNYADPSTDVYFAEINRYRAIKANLWAEGFNCDFLETTLFNNGGYDLIITNPPFDYALEFIEKSLTLLNDDPHSRLIFLLPIDTFSAKSRAKYFQSLDCHISNITIIPGRIDYLKDGVPVSKTQKVVDGVLQYSKNGKPVMCGGRQISDAIFTIKKGKDSIINFAEV